MNKFTVLIFVALGSISTISHAQTIGSAFSYQGELIDNGSPANGDYDFGVDLYMTEIGGLAVITDTHDDVPVENGLFNLEIDFGDVVYEDSDQYYIELRVAPSVGGATAVLSPRTKLLAVPYATQSQFVASGGGTSPWDVDGTALSTLGEVGIGTTNPSDRLEVSADLGENALRVLVNGATRFRVNSNGGSTVGGINTPPERGLYIHGDVKQETNSNGMVKFMLKVSCDSTPTISQQYNGTNISGSATITQLSTGTCDINLPIEVTDAYITATSMTNSGPKRVVECAQVAVIPNDLLCTQSLLSSGAGTDGIYHILIY